MPSPIEELRRPAPDQTEIDRLSAAVLRMPPVEAEEAARAVRLQRFAMRVEQWADQDTSGESFEVVGKKRRGW
jgi:hypothetical protein